MTFLLSHVKPNAITDELLDLLAEKGRSLDDVLVDVDGELVVDEAAVAEIRDGGPSETLIDDLFGGVEELDASVEVEALSDIDFASIIATADFADPAAALAFLRSFEKPYIAAAKAEGVKNPGAAFYDALNRPLFRARRDEQETVSALEAMDVSARDALWRIRLRRARAAVDRYTDVIVRLNWGMTGAYVRRFMMGRDSASHADFQSAAMVGLMGAVDTFNPERGKFGQWAYKRIKREVLIAVRNQSFQTLVQGDFERRQDVLRAQEKLSLEMGGGEPSHEAIAADVGCTVPVVRRVLSAASLSSLDAPVSSAGESDARAFGETVASGEAAVDDQVIAAMDVAALTEFGLSVLDEREHYVLARRFGLDGEPVQCLATIGKQLALSREAVRQIEAKGLAKLLHPAALSLMAGHGRVARVEAALSA